MSCQLSQALPYCSPGHVSVFFYPRLLVWKWSNQILSPHYKPSFPVVFEPRIFGFGDPLELLALLLPVLSFFLPVHKCSFSQWLLLLEEEGKAMLLWFLFLLLSLFK